MTEEQGEGDNGATTGPSRNGKGSAAQIKGCSPTTTLSSTTPFEAHEARERVFVDAGADEALALAVRTSLFDFRRRLLCL